MAIRAGQEIESPGLAELGQDQLMQVLDAAEAGIIVLDGRGHIMLWNQWMVRTSGLASQLVIGRDLFQVFDQPLSGRMRQSVEQALQLGMPSVLSQKLNPHPMPLYRDPTRQDMEHILHQLLIVRPLQVADSRLALVQVFDFTSAAQRDAKLRELASRHHTNEMYHRAILASIADGVITTDTQGRVEYINEAASRLTGWSMAEAAGHLWSDVFNVIDESSRVAVPDLVHSCLKNGQVISGGEHELVLIGKNNQQRAIEESVAPIRDHRNEVVGSVLIFRDVSRSRELAAQISWQANHDSLTGLANRGAFERRLQELIDISEPQRQVDHCLLYLDLDQFKIVNDTCGHVAGDELLRQVSAVIGGHIRDRDTLARLGGDEFGILLSSCPIEVATRIANQIRQSIQEFRFGWGDKNFTIGVSIGVVAIDRYSDDMGHILGAADTACYAAKDAGRNQVHVFVPEEGAAAQRHGEMQWIARIQAALDENRLVLYGQPIVPIASCGAPDIGEHMEILVRMIGDDGKLIPPGAFIPAAERFGLMPAIDRWVVRSVFDLIDKRRDYWLQKQTQFAINLSGATLSDEDTLNFVVRQLQEYQINDSLVCFEITETSAITNLTAAHRFINTLKAMRCQFALDDFGSGLSSFAYLKNLHVDYLKIDGAFVKDMADDPIDRAMVEAIHQIGSVMGLKTIAEFVENDTVLAQLRSIGVDYAQGYGVAKPKALI